MEERRNGRTSAVMSSPNPPSTVNLVFQSSFGHTFTRSHLIILNSGSSQRHVTPRIPTPSRKTLRYHQSIHGFTKGALLGHGKASQRWTAIAGRHNERQSAGGANSSHYGILRELESRTFPREDASWLKKRHEDSVPTHGE